MCLVTFNYNVLIEEALGREFQSIDSYIDDSVFKLFKLHGSTNWARKVVSEEAPAEVRGNPMAAARHVIKRAAALKLADDYEIISVTPPPIPWTSLLYPAIAVPVEQKGEFECPAHHLALLRELLPRVTHVLIIGWRAAEARFFNLLREHMRPSADVVVCCGNAQRATESVDALRYLGVFSNLIPLKAGFSEFIASRQLGEFFLRAV